jgi:hypothetical protein
VRRVLYGAPLFGVIVLCASLANAQDCTNGQGIVLKCQSKGCFGQYVAPPPLGGILYTWGEVANECCGKNVEVFTGGDPCEPALLNDPATAKLLSVLSTAGVTILLERCDRHLGVYVPLVKEGISGFEMTQAIPPASPQS